MSRAPSGKAAEAEKLFSEGMALVEIAKRVGVSDGTVRSWKNRHGWGSKPKKNKRNVAIGENRNGTKNNGATNATLQKGKRGAPIGNQNAKGGRGNPSPKKPIKHGGYTPVFMDALEADEQELIWGIPDDEEDLLLEQIQLFSIRERRILRAINKCEEIERRASSGKSRGSQEHAANKDTAIARLETELSNVQGKKTRAIEALSRLRLEKAKLESENTGSKVVDDWIAAVLGEEAGGNG